MFIGSRRVLMGTVALSAAMSALVAVGGFGLSVFAIDDTMAIVDAGTPANDYQGTPAGKLTTTRASSAAYWSGGVLQSAGNNVLRRDFDPRLSSTQEQCGYLIEEARTNLILHSTGPDNAIWSKTNVTVIVNTHVAPDGATTADTLDVTTASTPGISQGFTGTAVPYTWSFYVKNVAGAGWLRVLLSSNGSTTNQAAWFNLNTGALGTKQSGITSYSIVACPNGWYRVSVTTTCAAVGETAFIRIVDGDSATTSVIGQQIAVWGMQVEAGSFASSYISTTSATVTRVADLVTLAGALFPLNQTEGTLYAKYSCMGVAANNQFALSINDTTTAEYVAILRDTNRIARLAIIDGSVQQLGSGGILSTATIADLSQTKAAAGYRLNDSAVAQAGETVQTDVICTMPATTQISFGNLVSGTLRPVCGWLFEVMYLPTRRTNSQLQAMVSGYASDSLFLMGAETQGLAFSASDQTMEIKDTGTPANNYSGDLQTKLGSIRTSAAMKYLPGGLLGWGPENLVQNSETLHNAYWTKTNCTIGADAIAAPDGTLTADAVIPNSGSNNNSISRLNIATSISFIHTYSRYVKNGSLGTDWVQLAVVSSTTWRAWFNLATGALGSTAGSPVSRSITALGNGWYRIDITVIAAAATIDVWLYPQTADGVTGAVTGDGVTVAFYTWGAQLERTSVASVYKPTLSSPYFGLRLDYDTRLTGGPGYLVEEARTNLALRSQEFDNASWGKTDVTPTANNTAAPDGTTTADLLTEGSAGTSRLYQDIAVSSGATEAFSVYLKRGNTDWAKLRIEDSSTGLNAIDAWFNLATGVIGTLAVDGTGANQAIAIQPAANGFYRCTVIGSIPSTVTYRIQMQSASADNSDTRVNGATYYAWGAQLEAGAFATSHIPTTTATVTRTIDAPNLSASLFPSALAGLSMFAKFVVSDINTTNGRGIVSINNNDGNDKYTMRARSAGYGVVVASNAVNQMIVDAGAVTPFANSKMAFRAFLNDGRFAYTGGSLSAADVSLTLPLAIASLKIGQQDTGTNLLNGWIKEYIVVPSNWNDATLQAKAA